MKKHLIFIFALCAISIQAHAGSLYLPVQLSPEIETRIERLFVQANMPIIKRPIAVKRVHKAIEKIKYSDPALARSLNRYLERYDRKIGITHFSAQLSSSSKDNTGDITLANQRGFGLESNYLVSFAAFWAANDWLAFNVGAIAGERSNNITSEFADGSFVSLGWDALQLDIGYRPHWLSPFQESSMLMSTNASSLLGATLSNTEPLSIPFLDSMKFSYEIFLNQMSESELILSPERDERLTGKPKLLGVHFDFELNEGMAIGFNRLMQFGGANRSSSPGDVFNAFFNTKESENRGISGLDFGNQLSSVNTRYIFNTDNFPISIYMEYAGEDTSKSSDIHLGNSALMFGVHLPKVTQKLDVSYELAEWQNAWYTNSNYGDGLTHHSTVLGHWAANRREFGDAVGARAQLIKANYDIAPGRALSVKVRTVENKNISSIKYQSAKEIEAEYSQAIGAFIAGGKLINGNDSFGYSYTQLSAFIRW